MGSTLEPCQPKITCCGKVFGFTELSGMLYLARAMPDAQSGLGRDWTGVSSMNEQHTPPRSEKAELKRQARIKVRKDAHIEARKAERKQKRIASRTSDAGKS
ncbi:hypothetical protein [Methylobacterium sp. E-045]|uniref:hypothetical protein n=1 Tax=Methylobacterium sp. E-045 TaxID=2836575 RepID=UPI001FBBB8F3|nr:hypothetical protein [Methylobacterium sp. E-045]MCJ2128717.1 hypothetical protein [Methylobacterium sp. E-045]